MKARIKSIFSPDIDSLEDFEPEKPDNFGFLLTMMAGPDNSQGEESFDITICTPKWLSENSKHDIVIGRHHLIVFLYDYRKIESFLHDFCKSCEGETWQECAQKLARLGHWEFEDYREAPFSVGT